MVGGEEDRVRVALIGDIGGHVAELDSALTGLSCDPRSGRVPSDLVVVQVGDLIDRGPDSPAAVRLAQRFLGHGDGRYIQLLGNHEGQRFIDLGLRHVDELPGETISTIRRWWADREVHLAVALDTEELGPVLVTHAGLSPQTWRTIGSPSTAAEAAQRLDRYVGADAGRAFTPRPDRDDPSFGPGVTWGEPADLYVAWLGEAEPPPFSQVHGHASAWSWRHDRWRKRTPDAVRSAATGIDPTRRHLRTTIRGRTFVGIDPGHLEQPRRPWAPLLLTVLPPG